MVLCYSWSWKMLLSKSFVIQRIDWPVDSLIPFYGFWLIFVVIFSLYLFLPFIWFFFCCFSSHSAQLLRLVWRLCEPLYCSTPSSSAHEILQKRILEWGDISTPGDLPDPGMEPTSLVSLSLVGRFFITSAIWEALSSPTGLQIIRLWPGKAMLSFWNENKKWIKQTSKQTYLEQ